MLDNESVLQKESKKERSLWHNRTFICIFFAYSISLFGDNFHSIALNLWVLQTTGSAKMMSLVLITHLVISMLFGSFAGTLADRMDRRKLMLITDFIRFVLVLGIALAMKLADSSLGLIIFLTSLIAFSGLFNSPSFNASLVNIVGKEKVQQAVGLLNIADNIVRISGLALGGLMVAALGGVFAVSMDALTFLLSGILVILAGRFPSPILKKEKKSTFKEDFVLGFTYIWKNPFAKAAIILNPLLILFFLSSSMLIQVMVVKVWKASPFIFGLIEACIPLGYVMGAGLIMFLGEKLKKRGQLIFISILLMSLFYILLSQIHSAGYAVPIIFLIGFLFSFSTLILNIILRLEVDSEIQGRVFGTLGSLTSITPPIGLIISSFFADQYGASAILFISGIGLFTAGIITFFPLRSIRSYQ